LPFYLIFMLDSVSKPLCDHTNIPNTLLFDHPHMAVAEQVAKCLTAFQLLEHSCLQKGLTEDNRDIPSLLDDEFGRLKIWSSNLGAHRSGKSSLDFRLSDATELRARVVELLESLTESLDEGNCTLLVFCVKMC
jgi:hypothetical protein